jgi:hypothetical protein
MLADAPLVVIGYRGAEPSIVDHLLAKSVKRTHNFRNGIYWCVRPGEALHPNVDVLRRAIESNFTLLEIAGFDELTKDLGRELASEQFYASARSTDHGGREVTFDDRKVARADFVDLDHDLMLTIMREYCTKLGRAPVTRETLPGLLREQGFLIKVEDREVPTVGCILLFGRD